MTTGRARFTRTSLNCFYILNKILSEPILMLGSLLPPAACTLKFVLLYFYAKIYLNELSDRFIAIADLICDI